MSNSSVSVRRESPIYHVDTSAQSKPVSSAGVCFKELSFFGHLTIRGSSDDSTFVKGIEEVLGLALPTTPLTSATNEHNSIHWVNPTEWLVLLEKGNEAEVESQLREKLTGHFSVVDVSGGQTLFQLSGDDALMVMKKSCGYDVEGGLPVGKTVNTHFSKASVMIHKPDEKTFLLVVRRSFADYVWRWLEDASQEYGLAII